MSTPTPPGDRQKVREAIAAYFGGPQLVTDQGGVYNQGGPLASLGLGTAFPYKVKEGAPDTFYFAGEPPGSGWGAVMTVNLGEVPITRYSMQWRLRRYTVVCSLEVLSFEPHLEVAEQGLDNLADGIHSLIYADPSLGTSDLTATQPPGRLIVQAGEAPDYIKDGEPAFDVDPDRGRAKGGMTVTFAADTFIVTPAPQGAR